MSHNSNLEDDEIDLSELFARSGLKLLIALFTGLSIFLSGYYALNAEKFTANAIFKIEQTDGRSGLSLPPEFGAIASLAGLPVPDQHLVQIFCSSVQKDVSSLLICKKSSQLTKMSSSIPTIRTIKIHFGSQPSNR